MLEVIGTIQGRLTNGFCARLIRRGEPQAWFTQVELRSVETLRRGPRGSSAGVLIVTGRV